MIACIYSTVSASLAWANVSRDLSIAVARLRRQGSDLLRRQGARRDDPDYAAWLASEMLAELRRVFVAH
jgi:hypothetical protein